MGPVEEIDLLVESVPTAVRSRIDNNCVSEDVFIALRTIAIGFLKGIRQPLAVMPVSIRWCGVAVYNSSQGSLVQHICIRDEVRGIRLLFILDYSVLALKHKELTNRNEQ